MKTVFNLDSLAEMDINRVAIACGIFDGMHLGHQKILQKLIEISRQNMAEPVIMTFSPHPQELFQPNVSFKYIYPESRKMKFFEECGIKAVVQLPFTKELSELSAENFLKKYLLPDKIIITDFCVGSNWSFGFKKSGDAKFLEQSNLIDFNIHAVTEKLYEKEKISSSKIRKQLLLGEFKNSEKMLGRKFSILGSVERGWGIATDVLNYPTANLKTEGNIDFFKGVYAVRIRYFDKNDKASKFFDGICNIGESPTFPQKMNKNVNDTFLEVHLINYEGNLYNHIVEVIFISKIRDEIQFSGAESLKKQILKDEIIAIKMLGKNA